MSARLYWVLMKRAMIRDINGALVTFDGLAFSLNAGYNTGI